MFARHTGRHAARTSLLSQVAPKMLCKLVGAITNAALQY